MSIGLLGKKIGMTQVFRDDGRIVPVTVIEAGPCSVLQVKTKDNDGYSSIQIGFDEKKPKGVTKALAGHFKKSGSTPKKFVKELKTGAKEEYKVGDVITVDKFTAGDAVDVTGISIGRGFQGGVKRWGWAGGDASHGSMHHRAPGGIQSGPRLTRVTPGHHGPGRMGNDTITVQNLEVVKIDKDNHLIVVKGSVPGHKNSYLIIRKAKKMDKAKIPVIAVDKKKGGRKIPKAKPAAAAK